MPSSSPNKKLVWQHIYLYQLSEDGTVDPYLGFVDVLVLILRVKLRLTPICLILVPHGWGHDSNTCPRQHTTIHVCRFKQP